MDSVFDDPGDLGFFDLNDEVEEAPELENDFYEPFPGEDAWE